MNEPKNVWIWIVSWKFLISRLTEDRDVSASIQQQYYVTKMEKERLLEEQMHLQEMKERIELDKEQTQTGEREGEAESQLELDLLQLEKERQMEEWIELEKEREHQHAVRMDDQKHFEKQRVSDRCIEFRRTLYVTGEWSLYWIQKDPLRWIGNKLLLNWTIKLWNLYYNLYCK